MVVLKKYIHNILSKFKRHFRLQLLARIYYLGSIKNIFPVLGENKKYSG